MGEYEHRIRVACAGMEFIGRSFILGDDVK